MIFSGYFTQLFISAGHWALEACMRQSSPNQKKQVYRLKWFS